MSAPTSLPLRQAYLHPLCIAFIITYIILSFAYRHEIPPDDASYYLRTIFRGISLPFSLFNFECEGHPSWAYLLLLAIPQYVDLGNFELMVLFNAALGATSIIIFYRLLLRLFRDTAFTATECAILAGIYALSPGLLVHTIFINADFGVLIFFLPTLYCLLIERFWLAALGACGMIFSKETGIAIYLLLGSAYYITFILRTHPRLGETRSSLWRFAPFSLPLFCASAYAAAHFWLRPETPLVHTSTQNITPLSFIFNFDLYSRMLQKILGVLFIINFTWLLWLPGLLLISYALWKRIRGIRSREVNTKTMRISVFFSLLVIGMVYLLTRYRFAVTLRYFLCFPPLLLIALGAILLGLPITRKIRVSYLTTTLILIFISNFRCIDPLAMNVLGTFQFGTRYFLTISPAHAQTNSLVYNYEYFDLLGLYAAALKDLQPEKGTVFFTASPNPLNGMARLNSSTYERTLRPKEDSIFFQHIEVSRLPNILSKPTSAFFIDSPNLGNQDETIRAIMKDYQFDWFRTFQYRGLSLKVIHFTLKANPQLP